MTDKTQHCSITYYNGFIVTEFHTTESVEGELVSPYDNPGNLGFVVLGLEHVGVSQEAYNALKTLRKGRDSLGELDIFKAGEPKGQNHNYAFGALGGAAAIRRVSTIETSRDWTLPAITAFKLIDNEVPEEAKLAIDNPDG